MEKLNICILSVDHQPQFLGGIKRVTNILGEEWIKQGHCCYYITLCNATYRPSHIGKISQFFLPCPHNLLSEKNADFLINFLKENHINIILHPHVEEHEMTRLAFHVRQSVGIPLICAMHFSPTHNYDITKASFFNTYVLGSHPAKWLTSSLLWLRFHLFKGKAILKTDQAWFHEITEKSDQLVLLSSRFLPFIKGDKSKVCAINNPIDPAIFQTSLTNKQKKVVWCGRLDLTGMKRVDRILRIWKKVSPTHPNWTLQLIGSGDTNKIKHLIRKYHINNVEVLGFQSSYEYFAQAAIIAMTSTTEGWGMVLIESSLLNCAPIAFDSYASVRDIIIDGQTGILVTPFDLEEYAWKLGQLMEDDTLRTQIATQANQHVVRFDTVTIAQTWLTLFERLIQESKL